MDSCRPFLDDMDGPLALLLLFRGQETEIPYQATQLAHESSNGVLVYEVTRDAEPYGTVWVDAQSLLPLRLVSRWQYAREVGYEAIFDYEPIPAENFNTSVPLGYTELPRREGITISGKVINEQGNAVAGADVYVPWFDNGLWGQTDENGNFVIIQHPLDMVGPELPMVLRAFKRNDPCHVAWVLIMDPEHKEEVSLHADVQIKDREALARDIPGNSGEIILRSRDDSRGLWELRGIVLHMRSASVIIGRVLNQSGKPVANARVWVDYMEIKLGVNEIGIRHTGDLRGEAKAFALTDVDGYYELTNLPDGWSNIRLEVGAEGYVSEAKDFSQRAKSYDFEIFEAKAVTVRGIVVDSAGMPLAFREVGVEFQGKDLDGDGDPEEERDLDIDGTMTDSQGRFELLNVPRMRGLVIGVSSDNRPHYWDEMDETRHLEFRHYLETCVPLNFQPDRKEYWIEIIPQRPDISIEVEVKDSEGRPLAGIPVGVSSYNSGKAEWFITKLTGTSDEYGVCTISEVPRDESLELWISQPVVCGGYDWFERRGMISAEFSEAVAASRKAYAGRRLRVSLEPDKNEYKVEVTLPSRQE